MRYTKGGWRGELRGSNIAQEGIFICNEGRGESSLGFGEVVHRRHDEINFSNGNS
jgi:hypothetical protein